MKRRIVSFLLCLSMIICAMAATGCGGLAEDDGYTTETGDENSALTRSSMTLSLWVPTYEGTSEESLELVEEAINKITQSEYDTAIKLYGIPSDEYEDAVKKQMADIQYRVEKAEQEAIERRKAEREAAKRGETLPPLVTEKDDESVNPYDLIVNSGAGYPHVETNQMDIFLIRGHEDYMYYVDNMYLQPLNENIAGTNKILTSYIYPSFFDAAKVEGSIYAVPNNHALGEYTYLLVNKELATKYGYTEKDLRTIANCQNYIEKVVAGGEAVTPVYGNIEPSFMQYWSGNDSDTFSVIATRAIATQPIEETKIENVFGITNYVDNTYLQKLFTEKGYISTDSSVSEFAVGLVNASPAEIEEKYGDDYYVNIHQNPKGSLDDYCQAMFGVSVYTKDTARAMEIITNLNTETELRTVLQYGVEDEHWKYDELDNSIIVKLRDDYNMNLNETGNVYMTYPDYGMPMDWSAAKAQNLDSYYPVTYHMTDYIHEGNAELIAGLDKFCKEIEAKVAAMDAETYKASIASLKKQVDDNEYFQKLTYIASSSDTQKGRTPENGWLEDNSIAYMWAERVALLLEQ